MKRILILEDNVKTLTSLEKMIREISPEIITFPVQTYEEACICAVKQQIDIFILDIILNTKQPGDTSGLAFAREMRNYKKYQLTPVIFITVLADPELYAYRELHSFGYLEKPFSMENARKLVMKALEYTIPIEKEKTIWLRKDGILFAVPLHKVICVETRNHILYMKNTLIGPGKRQPLRPFLPIRCIRVIWFRGKNRNVLRREGIHKKSKKKRIM